MAEQLKNTLAFDLLSGATVIIPHGLQTILSTPLAPDIIFVPSPDLSVSSDTVNVTLTNNSGDELAGSVLVESWHTIERAFGDEANKDLPVKPYIVVSVEGGNQPPQPPFADPTAITIYARTTGSDTTGNGTLATPYATFQRAVRDVPSIIPPNVAYFIDITGITETLPINYTLPAWKAPQTFNFNNFGKLLILPGAVNVYSEPAITDRVPVADAMINAGDGVLTQDSLTGGFTFTLNAARATWGVDGLKGAHLWNTVGGQPSVDNMQPVVVYTNTTTVIQFLSPDTPVFPFLIMKPGAELKSQNDDFNYVIQSLNVDSISFTSLTLQCGPFAFGSVLCDGGSSMCVVQFCDIQSPNFNNSCTNMTRLISSWTTGFALLGSVGLGMFCTRNLFDGAFMVLQCNAAFESNADVYDGCSPVEPLFTLDTFQALVVGSFKMDSCIVKKGMDVGIAFHGGFGLISGSDISENTGSGISVNSGAGQLLLAKVGSTVANLGDFGVSVDQGMQVSADVDTTTTLPMAGNGLRGAVNDTNVGTAVGSTGPTPWATIAVPPNNVTDVQTFSRIFQV